jgi:hypothetical protein
MNDFATYIYPTEPVWRVTWGREVYTASNPYDILAAIGESSHNPLDHKWPKRGLAYRAFLQYAILIDEELPDGMFLMKLAEYGLITVKVSGTKPDDVLSQAVEFAAQWYGMPAEGEGVVNPQPEETE